MDVKGCWRFVWRKFFVEKLFVLKYGYWMDLERIDKKELLFGLYFITYSRTRRWRKFQKLKLLYFEWSPPWHFKTATWDFMSAWSGQVRVDIQLISWNAFFYSQLRRLTGSNLLTFFLTYLLTFFLTCVRYTQQWMRMIAVEVRHATLASHDRGWGMARHTDLTRSRLRSGTPHWTHTIAVEVRHATLNSHDRGWGPARHTELTWSQEEDDELNNIQPSSLNYIPLHPFTILFWTVPINHLYSLNCIPLPSGLNCIPLPSGLNCTRHLVWTASPYHLVWTVSLYNLACAANVYIIHHLFSCPFSLPPHCLHFFFSSPSLPSHFL